MANNDFKVEIPISLKGGESKAGKKLADDFMKNIKGSFSGFGKNASAQSTGVLPGVGKIAASVGIIASIWQGIAPILKPVLKMLSILLTVLLLPLMPLIRQMVSGLAKTASNVGQAQEEAGGGMAGFIAGFGEILKSPTIWALAGVGLAGSFVSSLGSIGIAGLILSLISLDLVWDTITGGDESTLSEKLKGAGWAGLSAGLAALAFGAGVYAIPVGLLTFGLTLGVSMLGKAMQEEDLKTALLQAAAGSVMLGIVAGGIVALLGLGLGTAGVVTLAVGSIVFTLFASWKIFGGKGAKLPPIEETLGDQMTIVKDIKVETGNIDFRKFTSGIENTERKWMTLNSTIRTDTQLLNVSIDGLGQMIGSPSRGSYPLVYAMNLAGQSFINFKNLMVGMINGELSPQVSIFGLLFLTKLKQIEGEWHTMRDVSVEAINKVISNLHRIPRSITTTHYIRTVRV